MFLHARPSLDRLVRLRSLSPPVPGDGNQPFRTVLQTTHPANDGRRQAPQPYMGGTTLQSVKMLNSYGKREHR
jgi:hypothetical protein